MLSLTIREYGHHTGSPEGPHNHSPRLPSTVIAPHPRQGYEQFWIETISSGLSPTGAAPSFAVVARTEQANRLFRLQDGLCDRRPNSLAILRVDWTSVEDSIASFAKDFGLSPAVSRTIAALFRSRDVRQAAFESGVSYETGREYLEVARLAVGADTLPRLITLLGLSIGNEWPDSEETDELLLQAFDLTRRQARIAGLLADGLTREGVAERSGHSSTLIKKELAEIFAIMGVSTSVGLARVVVELRMLSLGIRLGSTPEVDRDGDERSIKIETPGPRFIVASDYGPSSGKPVLIFHSSMTSRPVNRALVRALHRRGFRPIAIDRPGFGDTSDAPVNCWGEEYYRLAARDVVCFCQAMGWAAVPILTRGAAQIVLALQQGSPEMIAAAVIMNPDPDAQSSNFRGSFLAKFKRHFVRRPRAVRLIAQWLSNSSTFERVRDHLQRAAGNCPADIAVMADEENVMDYYRSLKAFRSGVLDGFVREQVALATIGRPPPVRGLHHFALLISEHDTIHDPAETAGYWKGVLPDSTVKTVPGSGRFMSYSHPDQAVGTLASLIETKGKPTD